MSAVKSFPFQKLDPRFLSDIYSYLPNKNIAQLRRTSTFFKETATEYTNLNPNNKIIVIKNNPLTAADLDFIWSQSEENMRAAAAKVRDVVNIGILTCQGLEKEKGDDRAIIQAFKSYGVSAEHAIWNRPNDWKKYHAVIVRSTWDYCRDRNLELFLKELQAINAARVPMFNSLDTIVWNSNKKYLQDLASKGVPCIETIWVQRDALDRVENLMKEKGWTKCVLKPSESSAGTHTIRFNASEVQNTVKTCKSLPVKEWMLQPYKPAIVSEGEWSVLILDGKPVRFILKKPAKGNFLVQEFHGGTADTKVKPPKWLIHQVMDIFKKSGQDALAARIDVVRTGYKKVQVMEIEMIEPYLFFNHSMGLAKAFAWAVIKRLNAMNRLYATCLDVHHFNFMQTQLSQFREKMSVLKTAFTQAPKADSLCVAECVQDKSVKPYIPINSESFPTTISQYRLDIDYSNDEELQKAILVVAESVSSIYAEFLTPEGHRNRSQKLAFFDYPDEFPTEEEVRLFKENLKQHIIAKLNEGDEDFDRVYLSTDYAPEHELKEVLRKSGITFAKYRLHKLFPEKTSTQIYRRTRGSKIQIRMTS